MIKKKPRREPWRKVANMFSFEFFGVVGALLLYLFSLVLMVWIPYLVIRSAVESAIVRAHDRIEKKFGGKTF